ncbi:Tetraacyldisaccharide 4'-kinase [Posidoniimonas polymericola]|uniref:Tetraacyldisaccharide 4'-kinase n=1 Tax=Posidoniimonas polymericola TaxID=2528002 RepID=A0A5C5YRM3_9BACT|nr:tetraacyldisaccharide 4'-kinase [Posidoniimonas polymericola]TWT77545.1 Tetraacyldisaccharide 4'-kinase [Posidoniimonas polymericola]
MNEQFFHQLVSGKRRGPAAALLRAGLWGGQWPYRAAVSLRNRRFDKDSDAVARVSVPVISIGNLTVGGTGKTPMVKWVARYLREAAVRVAIVSRGYGAEQGAVNDEAIELEQSLPDVPHLQDPDRVASARIAIEELETQLILMDDGFQHRRLGRDLDIVLLDATCPFGHGHLLPRGLLREPVGSLRRADVICLTRADLVDESERRAIKATALKQAPQALWCEATHAPQRLISSEGREQTLATLDGTRVAAFCGIGNPAAFRRTLESLGCKLAAWREFPDHHRYTREDIDQVAVDAAGADLVVCTHKDLAKVQSEILGNRPLWALEIAMQWLSGEQQLAERLNLLAQQAAAAE